MNPPLTSDSHVTRHVYRHYYKVRTKRKSRSLYNVFPSDVRGYTTLRRRVSSTYVDYFTHVTSLLRQVIELTLSLRFVIISLKSSRTDIFVLYISKLQNSL